MERPVINLEKRTIDDLVDMGALHFQMETPSDSIYSVDPLANKLSQVFEAHMNHYEGIEKAEKLSRVTPKLIRELVQNAIEHGNGVGSSKLIDGYFLWEEDPSGNAVMHIAVKDEGKGFNVNKYKIKNHRHGGAAIPFLKEEMDYVYSIGSAVYAAKVIRRADAQQVRIDKAA